MSKEQIKKLIADRTDHDGLTETGIEGVRLFRATQAIPCVPAVYEPCIVAIVSGAKEAILDGNRYVYDDSRYLCCPMSMPVKAGTPTASAESPLYGVFISLDLWVMTELALEMETAGGDLPSVKGGLREPGIRLTGWDATFTDALLRLLQLGASPTDMAVLGTARVRELYYAILKGEAGIFVRQAFGAGNAIARSIAHVSSHLDAPISIDDMATRAGMSRAAFHRKFKQVTTMAPIQFVKSMRLNNAAMKIAGGMTVNEAAIDVGYVSPSQFSREFKRMYGQSPREWSDGHQVLAGGA
ncbi:AraC family transcriptional regulator [Loktanella sp. D2R18]|uniref:AraC family transcriptional regulator n=1 Tax=Rhodobacterales TaxID=204455 RepID=UPI000DEBB5D6|nr:MULTISPECIES: AraC family transcriptional regulator [Rhodobacterales]MDO6590151.1 AraC family transcriptional regulator [Yoonia sp. 1_MG-2023]RBW45737.1 AraC family transcriptional regulator [Loktanella sp. D2R18]